MPTFTATCHTQGCANFAIPIPLYFDEAAPPSSVQCGVCSQPITDTQGLPT